MIRFVLLSFVDVQWTGAGVTLETGASAVQHVAVALRREEEPAPIPRRQMVVLVVLETTWRLRAVTLILAQVIVLGARLSSNTYLVIQIMQMYYFDSHFLRPSS